MADLGGKDQLRGTSPSDQYLQIVASRLRMPEEAGGAILDELAVHIDDAISAGIRSGLAPEEAERDALARLGSPHDLGEKLRRTHQSRRRLLAAVGGGAMQAMQGAFRGYLWGLVASLPLMFGGMLLAQVAATAFGVTLGFGLITDLFAALVYPAIWGAAWLSARYVVEGFSARSLRVVEDARGPIACIGAGLITIPVALVPADHTHLTIVAALATPFVFVAGALTTGRGLGERIRPRSWTARMPTLRRAIFVAFVVFVIASIVISVAIGGSGRSGGSISVLDDSSIPAQQRWIAAGFDVVAPTVVDLDDIYPAYGFARDGYLLAKLPDDRIDWDDWPGLRFEVWAATEPHADNSPQRIVGRAPLGVMPVTDPWTAQKIAVRVGYPDAVGFLMFLVAQDPVSGRRMAFGRPEGDDSRFHGSVIDWFELR
jgi:HAAS domain-containing protein